MSIKTNSLKNYYIISFFQFFIPEVIGVSYVLFLLHKGLNLFEVNILMSIMFLLVFCLEIPTGAIADLFGRKISVVLGFVFYAFSAFIYSFFDSFFILIIGQLFWALSISMQSGAFEAWIVDKLKHDKNNISHATIFSRAGMMRNISGVFCGLLGAYLANIKYEIPWLLGMSLALLLALYCLYVMDEPYFKGNKIHIKNVLSSIRKISKESIDFGISNNFFFYFIIVSMMISFSNAAGNMFQQPRLVGISGQGIWIFGWIKAGYSLSLFFGSWLTGYLANKGLPQVSLILFSNLMIGTWLLLSGLLTDFYPVLIMFLIYEIGRGMFNPAKQIFLNTRIESDKRATILSFESMMSQLGMILGLLITGYISRSFDNLEANQDPIRIAWIIAGIIPILSCFFISKINYKK